MDFTDKRRKMAQLDIEKALLARKAKLEARMGKSEAL